MTLKKNSNNKKKTNESETIHQVQNEGNKNIQFLRFLFKKVFRFIKLHSTGTARQNEGGTNGNSILQIPRNIVVIDEYY
jgi:hypothetical protein